MKKTTILQAENSLIIRHATTLDAKQLIQVSQSVVTEGIYCSSDPDEFTITYDKEQKWISDHISSQGKALFVAVISEQIVGFINFANGHHRRNQHVGEMAITIAKQWRNIGIGTALITTLLNWAEDHPFIEKINLLVFHTNTRAIHVYKKLGFINEGTQKGENKQPDGTYIDDLLMAYWVKHEPTLLL